MKTSTFLAMTAAAHTVAAAGVALHARSTGRDPGRWLPLTLVLGVVGVVGYALDR